LEKRKKETPCIFGSLTLAASTSWRLRGLPRSAQVCFIFQNLRLWYVF